MTSLVADTSALVAVLTAEPGHEWLTSQLQAAQARVIAAPTAVELGIVLEARAPDAVGLGRRVLHDAEITVVPFDADLADRAADAWRRYGKGRHPAGLNLSDCYTYALAEHTGWPILAVGGDFSRTPLPVLVPDVSGRG